MRGWASEILDSMQGVCEMLEEGDAEKPYTAALAVQAQKISNVEATPSARVLKELKTTGESFFAFGMRLSKGYKSYFNELVAPETVKFSALVAEASQSLQAQADLEQAPQQPFREYLGRYLAD
jgi:glutamate--cysteine ligase